MQDLKAATIGMNAHITFMVLLCLSLAVFFARAIVQ